MRHLLRSQTVQYGVGYAISAGSRLLRDLLLAKVLGSANFGLWAGLSVIRQYSAYSDIGFTNGLGRLLPKQIHEGRVDAARLTMGNAWLVSMSATVVFSAGALIWARPKASAGEWVIVWGTATLIALMFLEKQLMFSSAVLSSAQRVGEAGLFLGLLGIVELVLCLALASLFGLYGLFAALLIAIAVTVSLMWWRQPLHALFRFDHAILRELALISFVLMGYGLTNVALHNADRVAILLRRGAGADLGAYHLALTVSLTVNYLPYIVLSVLIPRMYRRGGERPLELRPFVLMPTAMMTALGVFVGAVVWVVTPAVTAALGVTVERAYLAPLLIAELAFSISMVSANVMVALDRGARGLVIRLCTVAIGFVGSLLLLDTDGALSRVAWLMAGAQILGALALGVMAARATSVRAPMLFAVILVPLGYALAVVGALEFLVMSGSPQSLLRAVLKASLVCLALAPLGVIPLAFAGRGARIGERARAFFHWADNA